jgi:hypothetical protein
MSVGHSPNEGERYGISEPARLTRKSHVLLLEVEFGFVLPFDGECHAARGRSPPPRLSVRMFGSGGKKRANASSNCAAL